jgi:mRNA interferase HigB
MRIIALRTLREFWELHSDAEHPIKAWYQDAVRSTWNSPHDIKRQYANASIINNERVVFNIKGNDYRLIVAVNYKLHIVSVKFVGSHAQYDRIDAASIEP